MNIYLTNSQKQNTKDICNFLTIYLPTHQRYRARQLEIALQKKLEIKKQRTRVMKLMKGIILDKKFLKNICSMLERSGLSLHLQQKLALQIKKLILDFTRDLHTLLDLSRINLKSLPLSLRRFIIALAVLKAEIVNLHRIFLEKQRERQISLSRPKINIESRRICEKDRQLKLDLKNHELYTLGVSLSRGNWNGVRGRQEIKKEYKEKEQKDINKVFKVKGSKKNYNYSSDKKKNEKKYKLPNKNKQNYKSKTNERHFWDNIKGNNIQIDI